jgi:hypothetical protein
VALGRVVVGWSDVGAFRVREQAMLASTKTKNKHKNLKWVNVEEYILLMVTQKGRLSGNSRPFDDLVPTR